MLDLFLDSNNGMGVLICLMSASGSIAAGASPEGAPEDDERGGGGATERGVPAASSRALLSGVCITSCEEALSKVSRRCFVLFRLRTILSSSSRFAAFSPTSTGEMCLG